MDVVELYEIGGMVLLMAGALIVVWRMMLRQLDAKDQVLKDRISSLERQNLNHITRYQECEQRCQEMTRELTKIRNRYDKVMSFMAEYKKIGGVNALPD